MIDLFDPVPALMVVFSIMVPLAIVAGRYAVRSQRQHTLNDLRRTLENTTGRDAAFIPSFEFALQKYDLTEQSSGRL